MNFLKIGKILQSKTVLITILSIILFFLFSDISFAEDVAWATDWDKWIAQMIRLLQDSVKLLAALLWIITSFVSIFLHPSWINWSIFWFDEHLKTIWILISNVVYFLFALILVWVAFMNIIWKWENNYALKQALPKFVIWVLIVPVSWFFIQFVLSISSILTISVLSLPFDTFKDKDFFKTTFANVDSKICTDWVLTLWDSNKPDPSSSSIKKDTWWFLDCATEEITLNQYFNWINWQWWTKDSIFWIISIYTYGVMNIQDIDKIQKEAINGEVWAIWDIADLLINKMWFDLLFFIVYFILMVALFMALFTRWVWMWIYAMFSPIFWLLYFFWKSSEWIWSQKFSPVEFIKLAIVPVLVWAALSFWLVFLFIVWDGLSSSTNTNKMIDPKTDTITFGWFSLKINSPVSKDEQFLWVWWFIWHTILKLFGIGILWMAIMSALNYSEITNKVVEPIRSFWESVWSLVASGAKYIPIIPAPWWGAMNAEVFKTFWNSIANIPQSKAWDTASAMFKKYFDNERWVTAVNTEVNRLNQSSSDYDKQAEILKNILSNKTNSIEDLKNSDLVEYLKKQKSTIDINADLTKDEGIVKALVGLQKSNNFKDRPFLLDSSTWDVISDTYAITPTNYDVTKLKSALNKAKTKSSSWSDTNDDNTKEQNQATPTTTSAPTSIDWVENTTWQKVETTYIKNNNEITINSWSANAKINIEWLDEANAKDKLNGDLLKNILKPLAPDSRREVLDKILGDVKNKNEIITSTLKRVDQS